MKTVHLVLAAAVLFDFIGSTAHAAGPGDPDTQAWWRLTAELSDDSMEGRDTGSPAHERAAQRVAERLAAAGIKPLGENGGWLQSVPMAEVAVSRASFTVGSQSLRFLYDWTIDPSIALPADRTFPLAYRGYCAADALGDVAGKLVICHGSRRSGMPSNAAREKALRAAGAVGMAVVADPGFAVEPPRWPFAYARKIDLAGAGAAPSDFLRVTLNADALGAAIPGHDAAALVKAGSAGDPLPAFDSPTPGKMGFTVTTRTLRSANVVGLLPGTDPALANQAIVLSAHLDGYGHGEPVNGDGLYNGTLDDAAYVALLERLAERRSGKGFARPIVFLIVTARKRGCWARVTGWLIRPGRSPRWAPTSIWTSFGRSSP